VVCFATCAAYVGTIAVQRFKPECWVIMFGLLTDDTGV